MSAEIKYCQEIKEFINILQERKDNFYSSSHPSTVVSIISSFFHAHKHFEETYNCLNKQSIHKFEWIIVDDCSTDQNAITLFKSLAEKTPKIKTLF